MDFRELQYVVAIAEHKTISKAAEALYITQPSLSRFLANLEEEMNLKLFERINKRLFLTYAGQQYVNTANHIFALKSELDNTLNEIARSELGSLRIATTQTHGKYVLPRCLSLFRTKYPNFEIILHEGGVDVMEKYLADGLVDLSIYSAVPGDDRNPDFEYLYINSEEIVLALSDDDDYSKMAVPKEGFRYPWLDLRQLDRITFLMMPMNWRVSKIGNLMLKEAGIKPEKIIFATLETAVSSAAYGVGGCFVADICKDYFESAKQPRYYSVGRVPWVVDFFVAKRKSTQLTHAQLDFIEMIRSYFG